MKHIINWLLITIAVFISAELLPGVEVESFFTAFLVAVVLGAINLFLKPVLLILTLPINIFTLGIFTLVINAGLIMLTDKLVGDGFSVDGFWWALAFSLMMSLLHFVLHQFGKK
ncbi:MAG: phage holin family protein [Candidatus Moranbacteria bacterium]|nr:phage holin family protein [Candidatus Moranbacteria bacterium]